MLEEERKRPRLDIDFVRHHEDRLEAYALFSGVSLGSGLGALPHIANCREILLSEAVLVALNHNASGVDLERDIWFCPCPLSSCVVIIIGILEELKNESCFTRIKILRKPMFERARLGG